MRPRREEPRRPCRRCWLARRARAGRASSSLFACWWWWPQSSSSLARRRRRRQRSTTTTWRSGVEMVITLSSGARRRMSPWTRALVRTYVKAARPLRFYLLRQKLCAVRVMVRACRCRVPVQVYVRLRVLPHEDEAALRVHGRRRHDLLRESGRPTRPRR